MGSVTESAAGVSRGAAVATGDRELKFSLSAGRVDVARRWLEVLCRPDREYPRAHVWTIYYDTPSLVSLGEKINSDYLKHKIRLRWYSEIDGEPCGPAFIEAKTREGTLRAKVRIRAPYPAEVVARWRLQDRRLESLPILLRPRGVVLRDAWQPVLLLRYRRDRFVDPASGSRISLDADIAVVAVNHRFLPAFDRSTLGTGILEVKGHAEELPASLRPLARLGARQRSFSKFLAVYQHVTRSIT